MNKSGWEPVGRRLLIKPEVQAKETEEGFVLPENALKMRNAKVQDSLIVAVGGDAFRDFKTNAPKAGQMARTSKYVGDEFIGDDGETYKLINDVDIIAIKGNSNG